ncbi:MAG: hypothetical protein ACQUHE_05825 [Bacteroidia bacterium]
MEIFLAITLPIIFLVITLTLFYAIFTIARNSNIQTQLLKEILKKLNEKQY